MKNNTPYGIGYYRAEGYQKLVEQALVENDLAARAKLYLQAQQMFLADCGIVPLWSPWTEIGFRKRVKNFNLGPQGYIFFQDVYLVA